MRVFEFLEIFTAFVLEYGYAHFPLESASKISLGKIGVVLSRAKYSPVLRQDPSLYSIQGLGNHEVC